MSHAFQLYSHAELAWGKQPGSCRPGECKLAKVQAGRSMAHVRALPLPYCS